MWLPAERPEEEPKWHGMGTGARPGRRTAPGGLNHSTDTASAAPTCRRHFSPNTTLCPLPLIFWTGCAVRVITENAAALPAAPLELRWAQQSAQCPLHTLAVLFFTVHRAATPAPLRLLCLPGSEVTRLHIQQCDWRQLSSTCNWASSPQATHPSLVKGRQSLWPSTKYRLLLGNAYLPFSFSWETAAH